MLSGNIYSVLDECGILSDPIFVCYQIIITRTSDECGIIITLPRAESGLTSCSRHSGLRPSCRQHSVRPDSSLGRVMNIPHSSSFEWWLSIKIHEYLWIWILHSMKLSWIENWNAWISHKLGKMAWAVWLWLLLLKNVIQLIWSIWIYL